jgi:hypothetical protein
MLPSSVMNRFLIYRQGARNLFTLFVHHVHLRCLDLFDTLVLRKKRFHEGGHRHG